MVVDIQALNGLLVAFSTPSRRFVLHFIKV